MNNIKLELPNTILIEDSVVIGDNVEIKANTIIRGNSSIGNNVILGPNTEIIDSIIKDYSTIKHSLVINSKIGRNVTVGPFSHIRDNVNINDFVRIGNYVELKNSEINENTKISHLSYVGDSEIGRNVNIGAGVITCNYDGKKKNKTVIKDNVFIGSNSSLIAPLIINENSKIAAGSTITKDVEKNTLAIARAYQLNKQYK
jgi:bifunctional UDP-N-acetylglucosamine pyrophosphorylase/glucosamine-1-phosphate N-acetyltransferase